MNGRESQPSEEPGRQAPDEDLLERAMPGPELDSEPEAGEVEQEQPPPRIYVASLSDYNAGRLHGAWIDAAQEVEELYVDISTMLAESLEPAAEEWAVHDFEGFGSLVIHEYENVETISRLALGIAEHGFAPAAWAGHVGGSEEELAGFSEAYMGRWPTAESYAEAFLEQLGLAEALEALPDWLQPYVSVDVPRFAHALESEGEIWTTSADEGGVHVFLEDGAR